MGKYLQWIVLTSITGSPLLAAVVVFGAWFLIDHWTLGVLPSPFGAWRRWRRMTTLERLLANNPHDRRARREYAEFLLVRKRYAQALATLRPNLEAGDEDVETLLLMGVACLGSGHNTQGEQLLNHAEEFDPKFRHGEILLERGRWRLARADYPGARDALEKLLAIRHGTIEGRVLLARAYAGLNDLASATRVRREAWHEYSVAPRFVRRRERWWAWRLKPHRPILYACIALVAGAVLTGLLPRVLQGQGPRTLAVPPASDD